MKTEEHNLQKACITWFRLQFPNYIIFAIPNGAKRTARQGRYYKEEGLTAGVPDLMIAEPRGQFAGLFVEMKVKPNRPSKEQKEILKRLEDAGYKVSVCYSFEDFEQVVAYYLGL